MLWATRLVLTWVHRSQVLSSVKMHGYQLGAGMFGETLGPYVPAPAAACPSAARYILWSPKFDRSFHPNSNRQHAIHSEVDEAFVRPMHNAGSRILGA
jgi:hypothetical protein